MVPFFDITKKYAFAQKIGMKEKIMEIMGICVDE